MPTHGVKLDLEFLGIALGAGLLAYYISGEIISNVLFTSLISILFFLIGLHLDVDELKKCGHHKKEVMLGWAFVYILTPLTAFGVSSYVGGALSDAFIAIGVSAAAIGSTVVFSNRAKGNGNLALMASGTSLLIGFIVIPLLLLGFPASIPVEDIAVNNLLFLAAPLALGVVSQRFENVLLDDLRHQFSKVALWLVFLVMAVQFKLVYDANGLALLQEIGLATVLMAGFVSFSFAAAYYGSKTLGLMERDARALGFVSSSKSLAISLFIASQLSGAAVLYVSMYYFIRQGVTGGIMELFRHDELESLRAPLESFRDYPG